MSNKSVLRLAHNAQRMKTITYQIPGIWWWAVWAKLLYVHSKEADIDALDLFKCKDRLG